MGSVEGMAMGSVEGMVMGSVEGTASSDLVEVLAEVMVDSMEFAVEKVSDSDGINTTLVCEPRKLKLVWSSKVTTRITTTSALDELVVLL